MAWEGCKLWGKRGKGRAKVGCDTLALSFGMEKASTRILLQAEGMQEPSPLILEFFITAWIKPHAGFIQFHLPQARRPLGFDCSKSVGISLKDK